MVQEGDTAPELNLAAGGRELLRLKKLRGAPVVVYFYPKDDTSGCTKEALDFQAKKQDFDRLGAAVIGISPDSLVSHEKFKAKHGLRFALASDADKTAARAYGVWVSKSMYGRSYMGVERATFLIDGRGKVARVAQK